MPEEIRQPENSIYAIPTCLLLHPSLLVLLVLAGRQNGLALLNIPNSLVKSVRYCRGSVIAVPIALCSPYCVHDVRHDLLQLLDIQSTRLAHHLVIETPQETWISINQLRLIEQRLDCK